MLIPKAEIVELTRRLDAAPGPLRLAAVPSSVSPLDLARAGAPLFGSAQYFSTPAGESRAGLGVAWEAVRSGPSRFLELDRAAAAFGDLPEPFRLFVGFAFSPDGPTTDDWRGYGGAVAVLPRLAVGRTGGEGWLMAALPPSADPASVAELLGSLDAPGIPEPPDPGPHSIASHPSPAEWRGAVADAVASIRAGSMDKVVLGRSVVVTAETPSAPFDLAAHLAAAYPQCYAFGWQSGDAAFIGASPELLLDKTGPTVRLNPLAGSAARGEGEDDDRWLGEALMASAKDRREHAIVVDDIRERLGPFTEELSVPDKPSLRRMATVQHLSTEIVGSLGDDASPFQLLDALHPTPAVGGTPRPAAVAFIDKVENLDRGWYTGGIGWATPSGDCSLALSLRCALIRGVSARLYAGAGIVADSDPEGELVETRLKLRPLLELLSAT